MTGRQLIAGHHIAHRVIAHMAHMDAAGGIGEHFQNVILWTICAGYGLEGFTFGPSGLPFGFYLSG